MKAATIDEVLSLLSAIIADASRTNSRAGYFAALYYKVTMAVKEGIQNNYFEDGPRMEQLDATFANRYLEAYDLWKQHKPVTASWQAAFDQIPRSSPLVIEHLLLGMNAHINLDLGIAAAEVARQHTLAGIHKDFNAINDIIASLTYQVIHELSRVSPLLSLMGLHATNYNSVLIQFSIGNARDGAWCFAEDIAARNGDDYSNALLARDNNIAQLAAGMTHPNRLLRFTLWVIHVFEWKKPSRIISALHEYKKTYFTLSVTATKK